jgi:uncharacterized protein (DUF885 family)
MKHLRIPVALTIVASLLSCTPKGNVRTPGWDAFVHDYLESTFVARPDLAAVAGRHENDGKLPDWSAEGLAKESARLKDWKARAEAFDTTTMDDAQRFERHYLIAQVDGMIFWQDRADGPHKNPTFYTDAIDPDVYVSRPYAPPDVRMKAFIAYARSVPAATAQIQANLTPPLPRTFVARGEGAFGGLADFFANDVPKVFASVKDTALQHEFKVASDSAVAAMKHLAAWFKTLEPTQTEAFAMGPDLFKEMLWSTERVNTPIDELDRIGVADLQRNQAALKDACAKFAPGKSMKACMEQMSANKPKDDPVAEARRQLTDLRAFIEAHNVVTIPGPEQALVEPSPPYMLWNSAYINIPGPYEVGMPSVYHIAAPEATWTAKERADYIPGKADLLFTSVHEVWPGHFLQFLHANRSPSKFGQVFVGYAFAEGWAHYAEEMMWKASATVIRKRTSASSPTRCSATAVFSRRSGCTRKE